MSSTIEGLDINEILSLAARRLPKGDPLDDLRDRLLVRPTKALVVVPRDPDPSIRTEWRILCERFPDARRVKYGVGRYENGSEVRILVGHIGWSRVAGLRLDVVLALRTLTKDEAYDLSARLRHPDGKLLAVLGVEGE